MSFTVGKKLSGMFSGVLWQGGGTEQVRDAEITSFVLAHLPVITYQL